MGYRDTPIGTLRWPVQIGQRVQTAQDDGSTSDVMTNVRTVHASIDAIGSATFWGATNTDSVSHRIRMRWIPYIDQTWTVVRTMRTPDGASRVETFRIRRVREVEGRTRFTELECMLEGYSATPPPP